MEIKYNEIKIKKKLLINKGSIHVPYKGVCQIKGNNGSGKTLWLNRLFYDYRDEKSICLLNQNNQGVFGECSVLENIAMSNVDEDLEKIRMILKEFGLEYILDLNSKVASGGEKRLISILRALISDVDIVLMDEPTNDLDFKTVNILVQMLEYYKKQKLFIIVSHDDRLDIVTDVLYIVNNKKMILRTACIEEENEESWASKKRKWNETFVNMYFKRNHLISIVTLLFLSGIIFCQYYAGLKEMEKYPQTYENQIDIYIPLSSAMIVYNMKGGISTVNMRWFNANTNQNIQGFLSYINNAKDIGRMAINYGLDLKSTNDYTVYKMEYYNAQQKQHFITLDTYVQMAYGTDAIKKGIGINTDTVFSYPQERLPKDFKEFDEIEFRRAEKELENIKDASGEQLKVLHLIILLNDGYTFWDFIETEEVQKLTEGNFIIYSNETIELSNQLNSYYVLKRIVGLFAAVILFTMVLVVFVSLVILYDKKWTIIRLRDYGISYEFVFNIIQKRCQDKVVYLLSPVILFLCMLYMAGSIKIVLTSYRIGILIIYLFVEGWIYKCNKNILARGIEKMYGWRYRC